MDDKKRELFEVKDDEEQRAKLQDICDLLLAAGYFRVRVKGLSAFDKVVGGIVWCLELCAVDVDVNFLFRENLNIGEKIEITEKIIKVLIAIKCAYALEPHQIQGLDTVKILPVVQWLVKRAMETRESLNDHLSSMANLQFRKSFPIPESEKAVTETSKHLSKLFQPQRKFKKVVDPNQSLPLEKQVISTLMEYGHQSALQVAEGNDDSQPIERTGEVIVNKSENKKVETRAIAQRVSSLIHQQADVISEAIQGYAGRQTEREGPVDELAQLQTSHKNMTEALDRVSRQISSQEEVMGELQNKLADLIAAEKQLADRRRSLSAFDTEENRQVLAQLDELIIKNEAINADRKQFKSQCKDQLEQLQLRNQGLNADNKPVENENKTQLKLDHVRDQLNGAQKTLGEKNVAVSRLKRQLDSVPGNAELNQYQRRFTELCTQVNEKQTELNGYYLLYNTLEDTKVYLNKELSLLTSIHDGFSQSMSTASGKGEFLQQMEKIVCAVKQNKNKIEKQIESLTEKHRDLGRCLADFASEEQHYREILKSITQESQKYKQLLQMQKED